VRMGWGHRNTALAEYTLMIFAGGSALWGIGLDPQAQIYLLASWGAAYMGLASWVDHRWKQREMIKSSVADV
jgi:UDP-GlcNAc:undecaprenyl-phosphate/decaprenyl-phosphate GlcNAc-1-phosphate transferase